MTMASTASPLPAFGGIKILKYGSFVSMGSTHTREKAMKTSSSLGKGVVRIMGGGGGEFMCC